MTSLEQLIEPIRHSPHMPEVVARLNSEMEAERARRWKFYEEMTPEQMIGFIDGEVILHVEQYLLEVGDYQLQLKSGTGVIKSTEISGFETDIEALFDEDKNLEAVRNWMK